MSPASSHDGCCTAARALLIGTLIVGFLLEAPRDFMVS
jgi:hypothetical protein